MITIDFSSNLKKMQRDLDRLSEALRTKAIVRALNTTAAAAKTAASRDIRGAGYQITAKAIKRSIEVRRATSGNLQALITASGKAIPRIAFDARGVSTGVSYSIKGPRKTIPGAFIATMKSGHRGVFVRKSGTQVGKRGHDILNRAIKELYGPSIPTVMMSGVVRRRLQEAIRDRFPKELEREIRFLGLVKR